MLNELRGRVAVITGGANGLGAALAERCAAEGMHLALADFNAEALAQTAARLAEAGVQVLSQSFDVSDAQAMNAFADAVYARFGAAHLLCNNAGVALARPVLETRLEDWHWVLGPNLFGVINGQAAFMPRMLEQAEGGHVVNTASVAGLLSPAGMAAYNVSKHAVVTLTETLYHELQMLQAKVGVSVLCPGWVKTGIGRSGAGRGAPTSPLAAKIGGAVMHAIENATVTPAEVAAAVLAAVRENRFYILTHPAVIEPHRVRCADIAEQRNPSTLHKL